MIENSYAPAREHRNQVVRTWGKDTTGLIEYRFNDQGFRSNFDYTEPCKYAFFGNSIIFGIGVPLDQILTSYFENSQNYGLSGHYMNHHSVTNLRNFLSTPLYRSDTRIIFFWIDRNEPIDDMIQTVIDLVPGSLHISSGSKRPGAINLMPSQDFDVSGTHPGSITHKIWAKAVRSLLDYA